jgi:hypothetical protein
MILEDNVSSVPLKNDSITYKARRRRPTIVISCAQSQPELYNRMTMQYLDGGENKLGFLHTGKEQWLVTL